MLACKEKNRLQLLLSSEDAARRQSFIPLTIIDITHPVSLA
jgi:hypothetical protein